MHSTLLAFDIGTSGLKASLVDENLNIIRNVTTSYPTHHYPNGGCEQEAADWWMSAVRAMMMLRELAPEYVKRVDAIGVSGHMLGCLPMDKDGQTPIPARWPFPTPCAPDLAGIISMRSAATSFRPHPPSARRSG